MTLFELRDRIDYYIDLKMGHCEVMVNHESTSDEITTIKDFEEVFMDKDSIKEGKNDGGYYSEFEDILNPFFYDKVLLIHCL